MRVPLDVIGNIAILKFPEDVSLNEKKKYADNFLKSNKSISSVLEKTEKVKGRLRKTKTRFLAGENTRETIHNENGCRFFLNVDETYFSPRLSNERKIISEEIARKVKNNSQILVMFAGVAPFPVVIAKYFKQKGKTARIVSSELNRKASEFAKKNVKMNKVEDYVDVISGDSRKIKGKFDLIIFNPPYLPEHPKEDRETKRVVCGGKKGYETIERFLKQAKKHLNKNGEVLFVFSSLTNKSKVDEILRRCKYRFKCLEEEKCFYEILYVYECY